MGTGSSQDKQKEIAFFDAHARSAEYDARITAPAYCRGSLRAQARWPLRQLRPQPPFMWLYRDGASPFYSSVGVTENERPILARRMAEMFHDQSFRVRMDYLAGLVYRYVVSQRIRALLPIYNFIDVVFNIAIMRLFRPFVLISGEKLR